MRRRWALFIVVVGVLAAGGGTYLLLSSHVVGLSSHESLTSLPYVAWNPAKGKKKGVQILNKRKIFKGLTYYNSADQTHTDLINPQGDLLHRWQMKRDRDGIWTHTSWFTTRIIAGGNLLVLRKDRELRYIDWNSAMLWSIKDRFHHELYRSPNTGDIYTLTRADAAVGEAENEIPILHDFVTIVSAYGNIKKKIPLYPLFKHHVKERTRRAVRKWIKSKAGKKASARLKKRFGYRFKNSMPPDVFHANAARRVERDVPGCCEEGDILVSLRNIHVVAAIDGETYEVKWEYGPGEIHRQHHPSILGNGNILIFDNGKSKSRIIEVNLTTKKIVWQYKHKNFFTRIRGSVQPLKNGNILITESDDGRVFEIDRDGKRLWEFVNPRMKTHGHISYRATIYRALRITREEFPYLYEKLNQTQ